MTSDTEALPRHRIVRSFRFWLGVSIVVGVLSLFVYMIFLSEPYGPLQDAAHDGDIGKMQSLVAAGANINGRCEFHDWTALHSAADAGQVAAAEWLLQNGAKVDLQDEHGYSALEVLACLPGGGPRRKDTESQRNTIASMLIKRGANVNLLTNAGQTPLICAVEGDDPGLVSLLLQSGANTTLRDSQGGTALDIARTEHRDSIVEILNGK